MSSDNYYHDIQIDRNIVIEYYWLIKVIKVVHLLLVLYGPCLAFPSYGHAHDVDKGFTPYLQ